MSKRVDFDAETVRVLLDLANDPREVATDSQGPTLAVVVSDELWQKFETYQGLSEKKGKDK